MQGRGEPFFKKGSPLPCKKISFTERNPTMKKTFLAVISVYLLLAMLPIAAFAQITGDPTEGGNVANDEMPIATAADFEAIANYPTGSFYLTQDINLGGKTYTNCILPTFDGILDGNGYCIYNFTIEGGSTDSGIIQYAASAGDVTVRNLQIGKEGVPVRMNLTGSTATSHGILVGAQGGTKNFDARLTVSNVTVYCDIQADFSAASNTNVNIGGLLGASQRCFVYGCTVNGSITASAPAGQKVRLDVGGICGIVKSYPGEYRHCVNRATVTAESPRLVARPAGILSYATAEVLLDHCINLGSVTGTANIARAGGMIADAESGEATVTVTDCIHFGTVSATGATAANAEAAAAVGHYQSGMLGVTDFAQFGTVASNGASGTACATASANVTSARYHDLSQSPMHASVGNDFGEMYLETEYWNVGTVACQTSAASGGKYNIRLIATVDALDYRDVGFEGVAFYKENGTDKRWEFSKACGSVYQSILAANNMGQYAVSADELGGNYLLALSLKDIPANAEDVIILVRPFFTAEAQGGSVKTHYGNTAVLVMNNGTEAYAKNFSKNPIANFRWSKLTKDRAEGTDLRVLSWNILSQELTDTATTDASRADGIAEVISALAPDVMGVQEISATSYDLLEQKLGDRYTFVNKKNSGGAYSYTGILYDHTKWELLHSGIEQLAEGRNARIRLMNWIHLKNKESGETVVVMSAHWETKASLRTAGAEDMASRVKELETAYSCPVIAMGDFNAQEDSSAHKTYMTESGQQLVKAVSAKAWNLGFTGHNLGICYPQKHVPYSIDHITSTDTVTALYYETVINETVAALSDHFPIYADLQLP